MVEGIYQILGQGVHSLTPGQQFLKTQVFVHRDSAVYPPPGLNLHTVKAGGGGVGRGMEESGLQPHPESAGCCSRL